jgi:5-methylcytosine-specific restriction endonuclease McrBC regulatory subunit McrC
MMEDAKVCILLYYRYRLTIENTVDTRGSWHTGAAVHHNACFVRCKVDLHIKQATEEV